MPVDDEGAATGERSRFATALRDGACDGVIALFGGTFDPVHQGHLILAEWVRDALELARLVLVPSGQPPHKRRAAVSPAHHRLRMLELAAVDHPGFVVADLELAAGGVSYTIDTVRRLREHGARQVILLIGADSLLDLDSWREPEALLTESRVVVVGRSGFDIAAVPASTRDRVTVVEGPRIDIAASDIRARVRAGRSIRFLVPAAVGDYIARHGLYRDG